MGARAVRPMARRPSGGNAERENHAPPSQTGGAAARPRRGSHAYKTMKNTRFLLLFDETKRRKENALYLHRRRARKRKVFKLNNLKKDIL